MKGEIDGYLGEESRFRCHMSGPHFPDFRIPLNERSDRIFHTMDMIVERTRTTDGTTPCSIGDIARLPPIAHNDADYVTPEEMLSELRDDSGRLSTMLREI